MIFRQVSRSISRPANLQISGAQGLFSPVSMFSAGEQGAWYDPGDISTLFQDAEGVIPVTASGQVVGRMLDKSGRGNHATQSTAGSKPILRNAGGLWYLEFDGVDDFLVTGAINLSGVDKVSVFAGVRKLSDSAIGTVVGLSSTPSAAGAFELSAPGAPATYRFAGRSSAGEAGLATAQTSASYVAPQTSVISGVADFALSAGEFKIRANGVLAGASASLANTGAFSVSPLYIGRRGGSSLPFSGNIYGLVVRGSLTDDPGIAAIEKYLAARSGVAL